MKNKEEKNKNKNKRNKGELAVKIMAGFMAILMLFSVGVSLIYYFI